MSRTIFLKQYDLEIAKIDLAKWEREREKAVLHAPVGGVVTSKEVKVGDLLETGKPVVEIAEGGFCFEMKVSNQDIAHLRVGMPVRIKLDAYDYQRYGTLDGTVSFIAPDSDPGEGHRAATYVVKIELKGEEVGRGEYRGRVKFGMEGQAEIVTDRESLLSLLVRRIRQTISLW